MTDLIKLYREINMHEHQMVYRKIQYNLLKCLMSHVTSQSMFQPQHVNKNACEQSLNNAFTSEKLSSVHSLLVHSFTPNYICKFL